MSINNHIFKLNNKPLKNYPYPFQLSYCPIKSCCNDEYAKLNANNVYSKINTFNDKVVINSGNLQIKDLDSFPPTSPGFGNYASVNGNPYYYDYISKSWINLLENNSNTFTLKSNPGILDASGNTTFTIDIPNIYGQAFKYTLYSNYPPNVLTFNEGDEVNLQTLNNEYDNWGLGSGFCIFQPYICSNVSNGAYVFNSIASPGYDLISAYSTPATSNISNSYIYTSVVTGDYTGNGNNTQTLIGEILIPFY